MIKRIPSLSESSYIDTPEEAGDYIFSCFLASDYNQSYIYKDKISSYPYIIQQTGNNINLLITTVERTLRVLFERHFSSVEVIVSEDPAAIAAGTDTTAIIIYVSYIGSDGKSYSVGKLIENEGSKIKTITNVINTGNTTGI